MRCLLVTVVSLNEVNVNLYLIYLYIKGEEEKAVNRGKR